MRDGIVICEDAIASLKRFKDDAKEVAEGYECGITLAEVLPTSKRVTYSSASSWKNTAIDPALSRSRLFDKPRRGLYEVKLCQAKTMAVWHRI